MWLHDGHYHVVTTPENPTTIWHTLSLSSRTWVRKFGPAALLFAVIVLFFGFIIAREVPLFWGLDEAAHFGRAYQVSEGHFLPKRLPDGNYGGYVPTSVVQLDAAVHGDLANIKGGQVTARRDFQHEILQKRITTRTVGHDRKVPYNFPGSAAYSPVAYIAPSIGILACRLSDCSLYHTVFAARIFSLIAYAGVAGWAIWLLRDRKLQWLIFMVALLPMAVFQAAAVSADGATVSLSLLLFAIAIRALIDKRLSTVLKITLAVTALCLPLIKISYGWLDLTLIPVALLIYKNRRNALVYSLGYLAFVAAITMTWLYIARDAGKMIGTMQSYDAVTHTAVSAKLQTGYVMHHLPSFVMVMLRTIINTEPSWIIAMIGQFSLNGVALPLTAIVYAYVALFCAAFYARGELARYKRLAAWSILLAAFIAFNILATLYITFTPLRASTIAGVQGRYFIPLISLLMAGLAGLIPIKVTMTPRVATLLFSLSSASLLACGILYYGLATY